MGNNKVLKAGIWYTISNLLVKSIGFILTPIFARLISKQDMGLYNNFYSWITILCVIIPLNLGTTLMSAKYEYREKLDRYIFSINVLSTISIIVGMLAVNIFPLFFQDFFGLNSFYINCLFVYILFNQIIDHYQTKERFVYHYKISVVLSLVTTISIAVLSVVLVIMLSNDFLARVLGALIPVVIVGLILYVLSFYKGKSVEFEIWKYALPIALPFIPHLLSMHVLGSMDKIMITKICGSEFTAMYSVAYSCGTLISFLVQAMNNAFSPWLSDNFFAGEFQRIKKMTKYYVFIFFVFSVGAILVGPEILLVMGGKRYIEAAYVIPPVALSCLFQFIYCLYVNIEQLNKKTIGMSIASVISAIINYVLNSIFIPRYGYIVAAYTTLVGYLILLIQHIFLVYVMGYGKVYSIRFNVGIIMMASFFMIIINFSYSHTMIRLSLIIIYIILLLVLLYKLWPELNSFKKK